MKGFSHSYLLIANQHFSRCFGAQAVPPNQILKALPKIFGHTDKTVRAEGTLLTQSLYQCIGPALQISLADLKPVQVKELNEAFDAMDAEGRGKLTHKAERFTRAQAQAMESGGAGGDDITPEGTTRFLTLYVCDMPSSLYLTFPRGSPNRPPDTF